MKLEFNLHTLIFVCGPSGAGKSTLAKQLKADLEKQLESAHTHPNVHILSSDDTRRELIGKDYNRNAPEMIQASKATFRLMATKTWRLMEWPIAAHFIIIDATNLSEGNRAMFLEAAKGNQYAASLVVLDYKDTNEYEKGLDWEDHEKRVVHNHIRILRKFFNLGVKRRDYRGGIFKIRKKDFTRLDVKVTNADLWRKTWLADNVAHIIADVHGCFTEFKLALTEIGYAIEGQDLVVPEALKDDHLVLLGDLFNKGPESGEFLDFVYHNLHLFVIVDGNHENFLDQWFSGEIVEGSIPQETLDKYFTCTTEFKDDHDRLAKFAALRKVTLPFVRTNSFYAAHAPCEEKYQGKLDDFSQRHQRNWRIPRHKDTYKETQTFWETELEFWTDTAENGYPWQFAGHVPLGRAFRMKNKYLIDGGCVHGNRLNYIKVIPGHKCFVNWIEKQTPTDKYKKEKLIILYEEPKRLRLKAEDLDEDGLKRLYNVARHKVNFISGTMSPSAQNVETNELETLENALNYYKEAGVGKAVLQTKYMGSRANFYLNLLKPEESFGVTRRGYKIHENIKDVLAVETEKIRPLHPDQEWVLVDGELLPWFLMGSGLIDKTFKPIGYAIEHERDFLIASGFEARLAAAQQAMKDTGFTADQGKLKKGELAEKYGHAVYSTYGALSTYKHIPLAELKDSIETYQKQIELYGLDGEAEMKGFAVLKTIAKDGTETTFFDRTNEDVYKLTGNTDPYLVVDLANEDDYAKAKAFYDQSTLEKGLEGLVVKPWIVYTPEVAPSLKVRNQDYLTIIYGYDYKHPSKYDKLVKEKSIKSKVKTARIEFEIGKRMLEIPRSEISQDNVAYRNLVAQMINQEKFEATLDPRL